MLMMGLCNVVVVVVVPRQQLVREPGRLLACASGVSG